MAGMDFVDFALYGVCKYYIGPIGDLLLSPPPPPHAYTVCIESLK